MAQFSELNGIRKEFQEMRQLVNDAKHDKIDMNPNICDKIVNFEKRLNSIECSLNDREQYQRLWSVRLFGISVPQSLVKSHGVVNAVIQHCFKTIVLPVLSKADKSELDVIPPMYQLIENGHFLKSKGGHSLPPCIILRFHSRYIRNLFLRLKKKHMPSPSYAERSKGVKYYKATPDLTSANFKTLKGLRNDIRV